MTSNGLHVVVGIDKVTTLLVDTAPSTPSTTVHVVGVVESSAR